MASLTFMGIITLLVASLAASQNCVAPPKRVQQITYPSSEHFRNESVAAVKHSMNTFTTKFIKEAGNNDRKSFICSSMSVWLTLTMLALGAGGRTSSQLQNVLQLPDTNHSLIGTQAVIDSFNNWRGLELRLAQKLFVSATSTSLKNRYMLTVSHTFREEPLAVDFRQAGCASDVINEWCERQTNGFIKNIVKRSDFSADPSLVVVNAVYFHGTWKRQFNPRYTMENYFNNIQGQRKKMPFMYQESRFVWGFLFNSRAQFIILPYERKSPGKFISMIIVLPNSLTDLDYVEQQLETITWQDYANAAINETVQLYLPKFKIESELDLKEALECMGLTALFDDPDFSLMSEYKMDVSKIIHKALIEVDEVGSKAAAATAVDLGFRSLDPSPVFKADHPFIVNIVVIEAPGEPVFIFSGRFSGN